MRRVLCLVLMAPAILCAQTVEDAVRPAVADKLMPSWPGGVKMTGLLGTRIERSIQNRLVKVSEDGLLEGFRHRPGRQAWIGEHVGKWLHAASLAQAYAPSAELAAKLARVDGELIKCQETDGYLGTYVAEQRFGLFKGADWDVWVHKYNLLGQIQYYRLSGDKAALESAKKQADLLVATFGPDKKSIVKSGTHVGMAPSSVLEPIVLLYRLTGEAKYLDFAKHIVASWEQPGGPKILSSLGAAKRVDKVANGKAYEMLSCLVGVLELYRTTADAALLEPALIAWNDIVANRLYLTGSASSKEHFQEHHVLPNTGNICETCVTVTWMQFNAQLLRLTGDSKYADELERSIYNHLLAAQKPTGDAWAYYTQLEGKKPYGSSTNCCLSSGPRGLAMIPTFAVMTDGRDVVVNIAEAGEYGVKLADGKTVKVKVECAGEISASVVGGSAAVRVRKTAAGPKVVKGEHGNAGKAAVMWGPMVLAYEEGINGGVKFGDVALAGDSAEKLGIKPVALPEERRTWAGAMAHEVNAVVDAQARRVTLLPFAEAGADGSGYRVWMPVK